MLTNKSGIYPKGHKLLILVDKVEETTKSGIILHSEMTRKEQLAENRGTVVEVGSTAYDDQEVAWCTAGDRVLFAKYAGLLYEGKDGLEYRIINDLDIVAKVDEMEEWQ